MRNRLQISTSLQEAPKIAPNLEKRPQICKNLQKWYQHGRIMGLKFYQNPCQKRLQGKISWKLENIKKGATIDYNNTTLVASWPQCTHLHFFISLDNTWIWLLNSAAPYLCQHCLTYFSQVHKKRLHSCRGESCRNHFGCSLQRNSSGWSQWSPCTLLFHYILVHHEWIEQRRTSISTGSLSISARNALAKLT